MENLKPDISYLVAAHNAAPWIESAIRSALSQRGVRVEVIVADDASSDTTLAIVGRLAAEDARVISISRPISGGPAAARNSALMHARGEWIGILDADDWGAVVALPTAQPRGERKKSSGLSGQGALARVQHATVGTPGNKYRRCRENRGIG